MNHRRDFFGVSCLVALLTAGAFAQAPKEAVRQFELKADSPKFWDLFIQGSQLEKIATGFGFTEGPVWDPHGFLYVSDEEQNKLSRVYPDGRVETVLNIGDPDGSTLDAEGHLITTASVLRAIIQVDPDGKYKVLADKFEGKKFNSPNDIVLGPDGALYFTDPTLDLPKGDKQELDFQGVFRLGKDGSVRLLNRDLTAPNGLTFSPDGKRLYVNDTKLREIRVYDVGPNMELQDGRVFAKEEGRGGVPDGMRVDMKGNVYCTGPGGLWVWDAGGHRLGTIMLPESTANFNWGDKDYSTIYFSSKTSIYRLKTRAQGFVPGAVGNFVTAQVELVATGFPGGEGPVWSRQGFLIFSDYSRDRLYKYAPGKTPEVYREDSKGANGNTLDRQGRLYSCEYKSRRVTRTDRNGKVEVLVDKFEGKRFNAPNDIVVRRDGHVYFSDPLFTPLDHRDLDFYGVYHVTPKGTIEAIARMTSRPNGVALSPDGKILYVANTDEKNIRAYDLDRNGKTLNERVVISNLPGGPDGIRTDVKGNLYVAAHGVFVYSPSGRLLGTIATPVSPRNLAFGDSDMRTLYIVGNSIYRVRVEVAGSVQY